MRIGHLAERTGVTSKTIRYYEQIGLLPQPDRAPNGYRTYAEQDAQRLSFIRRAQQLGLPLDAIGEILALRDTGQRPCDRVVDVAERQLEDVDRRIQEFTSTRDELRALLDRADTAMAASQPGAAYCILIEADLPAT